MNVSRTAYFERRASGYLKSCQQGLWGRLRSAEWRALRQCLDLSPGLDVLDAGCGPGYYSLRMRETGGMRISGIDSSPAMITAYRAQGFEGHLGAIETFKSVRRYDRILVAGVLEFIDHPEAALANLAGLLGQGGRIVCLVPTTGLAGTVYQAIHRLWRCPTHVREPSVYFQLARCTGLEGGTLSAATVISSVFVLYRHGRE